LLIGYYFPVMSILYFTLSKDIESGNGVVKKIHPLTK
jgi:hypothetical protein